MRVKMLRTVEPVRSGSVRFEKGSHVDVSADQAKAWAAENPPAATVDNVVNHDRPARPDLSKEKQAEVDRRPTPLSDRPLVGAAIAVVEE